MSRYREVSCTMAHATVWYAHATGEAPSSRCSAVGVGPESLGRGAADRSRREFGLSLAANLSTQGDTRSGGETDPGTSSTAVGGRETAPGEVADSRRGASGVPHRAVDAAARGRTDPPEVRRALSSRARLEGPDRLRLELPEARATRRRARRGRDRALDPRRMAADKKGSWARGPTLHHENGLSSQRVARSETSPRFGTASPVKKLTWELPVPRTGAIEPAEQNRDS